MSDLKLEALINSKKPKYTVLDQLFPAIPSQIKLVRMFLDFDSLIINQIFDPRFDPVFDIETENGTNLRLCSAGLNTIAFLRHYFSSRHNLATEFYCFWSSGEPVLERSIIPEYKQELLEKRGIVENDPHSLEVRKYADYNMRVGTEIAEYIPGVYWCDTKTLNPDTFPRVIQEEYEVEGHKRSEILDIVTIGGSALPFLQYTAFPFTRVLCMSGESSKLLNKDNVLSYLQKKSGVKEKDYSFNSTFTPVIFTFAGYKKYGITGKKGVGVGKALGIVEELVAKEIVTQGSIDAKTFLSYWDDLKDEEKERLSKEFEVLSADAGYHRLTNEQGADIENCIMEKRDWSNLQHVLTGHFGPDFHINIQFLLD